MEFVFINLENIVGKGENAGYHNFLVYLPCFQMPALFWVIGSKLGSCGKRLSLWKYCWKRRNAGNHHFLLNVRQHFPRKITFGLVLRVC